MEDLEDTKGVVRIRESNATAAISSCVGIIAWFVTRVTRRIPLVEQKLLTLLVHLISPPFLFGEILVARSLVFCVVFLLITIAK
jgi:hypothetical protein